MCIRDRFKVMPLPQPRVKDLAFQLKGEYEKIILVIGGVNNGIPGAMKMATIWLIPKDAEKPIDGRTKQGKELKLSLIHICPAQRPGCVGDRGASGRYPDRQGVHSAVYVRNLQHPVLPPAQYRCQLFVPVSYTQLDVYKRQPQCQSCRRSLL